MSVKNTEEKMFLNTEYGDKDTVVIDLRAFKQALFIMRTLNNTPRQRILKLIDSRGKITVTEIHKELEVDQSTVSQHLAALRRFHAVKAIRQGHFVFYTIHVAGLNKIISFVNALIKG